MAKTMTKADMARQLDALRHRVSQLEGDKARLMAENATLRGDANKQSSPCNLRQLAMQRAKEEALRTGKSVRVQY